MESIDSQAASKSAESHADKKTARPGALAHGQVPLHPQGGSDLRLLALFSADVVHCMRRSSFAQAQALRQKMKQNG